MTGAVRDCNGVSGQNGIAYRGGIYRDRPCIGGWVRLLTVGASERRSIALTEGYLPSVELQSLESLDVLV